MLISPIKQMNYIILCFYSVMIFFAIGVWFTYVKENSFVHMHAIESKFCVKTDRTRKLTQVA